MRFKALCILTWLLSLSPGSSLSLLRQTAADNLRGQCVVHSRPNELAMANARRSIFWGSCKQSCGFPPPHLMRLRGGGEDEKDYVTFQIRCNNTIWGQSGHGLHTLAAPVNFHGIPCTHHSHDPTPCRSRLDGLRRPYAPLESGRLHELRECVACLVGAAISAGQQPERRCGLQICQDGRRRLHR